MDDLNITLCSPRPSSGANPNAPVLVQSPVPKVLPPNHILLRVDRFGFSANNTTYQALGEAPHFRYFEFHAPSTVGNVSPVTHGLIPVWGFATVAASTHPGIPVGERVYGYLAPARFLVVPISPKDINKHAFYVPRPHLPADRRPYNQLIRCSADPQYSPSPVTEDFTMLYRPLFWTAFWCEDWLAAARYRGAARVLVSSASAKTAFTLAYCMSKRAAAAVVGAPDDALAGLKVVGLTSSRNLAFTRGLGLYDEVVTYDDVESTSALRASDEEKWIYADVASSSALNARIFARLGTALVGGITLGMSTVGPADAASSGAVQSGTNTALATSAALSTPVGPAASAPGPAPSGGAVKMESFFMVEWLAIRRREWSTNRIVEMQATAWRDLMRDCPAWVRIERVYGGEAVRAAYEEVVSGKVGPERGFVWSMWNGEESGKIVARL